MDAALFGLPTWVIVTGLFVAMLAANEIGFRMASRSALGESERSLAASNMLKGSALGLVALLLGFSFSLTAGRHDMRRQVVLQEANAIGTCHLRAGLLNEPECGRIRDILRRYVGERLDYFESAIDDRLQPDEEAKLAALLNQLWEVVTEARTQGDEVVRTSQIVPAANAVIDLNATREWAAVSHLPISIFMLLMVSTGIGSLLVGHSSGQGGRRHVWLWLVTNSMFATVLFVVIDFDRPRRGLIRVDHGPLINLRDQLEVAETR